MSLVDQIMAYDRDIRINTFGDGDPNFNDKVDDSINPTNADDSYHGFKPGPLVPVNPPAACGISGGMPNVSGPSIFGS